MTNTERPRNYSLLRIDDNGKMRFYRCKLTKEAAKELQEINQWQLDSENIPAKMYIVKNP